MIGRRVFIYRNLSNRNRRLGKYSIQSREGKDYGLVVGHADNLVLENCEFKVSQAGRARVLRERQKNVHAGVLGRIVSVGNRVRRLPGMQRVAYNPYLSGNFLTENQRPVYQASRVALREDGVYTR